MKDQFLGGYNQEWWDAASKNRVLVRKYNTMDVLDLRGKYEVLKELLAQVNEKTVIEPPFYCDNGKNIYLGNNFYANYNFMVLDADRVEIGDNVVIGPNVTLCGAAHPVHPVSRTTGNGFPIIKAPIVIQDNVWIGAGTTVLMGVTIGAGSVVGAHSLVTKDIPPGVVAAGTPCKVIRPITEQDMHNW